MNYLATINTGNFLCDNVRASFQHAAKRWGAEYVEITEPFASGTHPFEMKLELPKYKWQPGYRVFFAEGDVLIRDDCPSPFDVVPAGMFAAAFNDQGELDGVALDRQRGAWEGLSDCLSQEFGHPAVPYTGQYFNTGVFLMEAAHAPAFAAASEIYKMLKSYGADDQTILSLTIHTHRVPIYLLDRRWNCVGPAVWQSAPIMQTWVTHYAKYLGFRNGRDDVLKTIKWNPFPNMPPDGSRIDVPDIKHAWSAEVVGRRWISWDHVTPDRRHRFEYQEFLCDMWHKRNNPDPPPLTDRTDLSQIPAMIT